MISAAKPLTSMASRQTTSASLLPAQPKIGTSLAR
jgi:hypothetical protein